MPHLLRADGKRHCLAHVLVPASGSIKCRGQSSARAKQRAIVKHGVKSACKVHSHQYTWQWSSQTPGLSACTIMAACSAWYRTLCLDDTLLNVSNQNGMLKGNSKSDNIASLPCCRHAATAACNAHQKAEHHPAVRRHGRSVTIHWIHRVDRRVGWVVGALTRAQQLQ